MTDEERRAKRREYYAANRERFREYERNYRKENKARIRCRPSHSSEKGAEDFADRIMKSAEWFEDFNQRRREWGE